MMDINSNFSCDDFVPTDSSSSSTIGLNIPCSQRQTPQTQEKQAKSSTNGSTDKCPSMILSSSTSSSSLSFELFNKECHQPKLAQPMAPNIGYELAMAKSIMQQYSSISGDNLFDHLSDIIKRVIDERPPNVIDFFEEFSRKVREQKLHVPERFPPDGVHEEKRSYKVAQKQLMSMNLPYPSDLLDDEDLEEERQKIDDLKLDLKREPLDNFRIFNGRVQHLQFYWNQCGFSFTAEDIFQLACSMDRLQTHPSIRQCRFWGMIYGTKAPYYIVEVLLTNEEIESRFSQMQKEIFESQWKLPEVEVTHIGPELTPGTMGWENYPVIELDKMKPLAAPIPKVKVEELFDIPPEPIGQGVNRFTYFVVNNLWDEWMELPICTPKQVQISRKIKKFFTGDLEADVISYPCFPGKEKHYLRAMISRITAGTYIAPRGYYRRMTKSEKRLFDGLADYEADEEETTDGQSEDTTTKYGEEEEGEEALPDNDIVLLRNEKYYPLPLAKLNQASQWLHIRPNILPQGRVVWFDEEKAKLERQKELKRLEKLRQMEEMGIEQGDEYQEEEEESSEEEESIGDQEEQELNVNTSRELGPPILSCCSHDSYEEIPVAWVGRFTSTYTNRNERLLVMRSNIWPGAYTFTFEDLCDSIYMGWGHKYVARNMPWPHLPAVAEEFPHTPLDFMETNDPSVEMEEAYRLSLLKKELKFKKLGESISDNENETHESDDDDDDDDEEEDEDEEEEE
uniref:Radial spokehead-like protein n=1 Tax=Stomoxys calcitrans TaxID=35570 RepID=A0A1I8NR69_STOCA